MGSRCLRVGERARYDAACRKPAGNRAGAGNLAMQFAGKFPERRPRRMRRDDFSRRLMRECRLAAEDLIYPVFVQEGDRREDEVPSLPGVARKSIDRLLRDAERCLELGVPAIALFPVISAELKSPQRFWGRICSARRHSSFCVFFSRGSPRMLSSRQITRATFPSTIGARQSNAIDATAPAV